MHAESYALMDQMIEQLAGNLAGVEQLSILDVGSLDVNGTFRSLVEDRGWSYTGLDVLPGKNVDVVAQDPFRYPFDDGKFDGIISGSTMEHVTAIWRWIPELVRVVKPGGFMAIHTHWSFPEHRYPIDCWRIMPDGMAYLLEQAQMLVDWNIWIANQWDICATARTRT